MDMFTSETENMIVGDTEQHKRIGVIEPENTINNEVRKIYICSINDSPKI